MPNVSRAEDEPRQRFRDRHPVLAVAGVLTGTAALTGAMLSPLIAVSISSEDKPTEEERKLAELVIDDGFEDVDVRYVNTLDENSGNARLDSLDLGACSLHGVWADFRIDPNGAMTDATYTFTLGSVGTTFEFDNLASLQSDILGEKPCQTLAGAAGAERTIG